jgi:hypothetical protein
MEEVEMKRAYVLIGVLAVAAACEKMSDDKSAAGDVDVDAVVITPMPAALEEAYTSSTLDVQRRIATLDRYRRSIEQRLPGADRAGAGPVLIEKSVTLPPNAFADVTDEPWAIMQTFYDGSELKRLRLLPPLGVRTTTEEFYFDNGKLVFVYEEPDGAAKAAQQSEFGGDAYYFGREGMIAWIRKGGKQVDPNSDEFKAKSAQLLKEAARFPRG